MMHLVWLVAGGIAWTAVAGFISYIVAVVAGLTGGMDFSGLGRMIVAFVVTMATLEIIGFGVIGGLVP